MAKCNMFKKIIFILIISLLLISVIIFRNIIYVETTIDANLYNVKYETGNFIKPLESYNLKQSIEVQKDKLYKDAQQLIIEAEELCIEDGALDYILIDNVTYEEYNYLNTLVIELSDERNIVCGIDYEVSEESSSEEQDHTLVVTAVKAIVPVLTPY